jgi:hypothetical protein
MLQGLDDAKLFVLMGAGAAIAIAGLVLLFRPQADQATTFIDILGLKFRSSSVGLIVFIIGAAFMATPLVIPERPETPEHRTAPLVSVGESPSIQNGGQRLEVERGDIKLPARAQAEEIEPNNHISEANQIEVGNTYGGSVSDRDEDWYVFRTGATGEQQLRVILRPRANKCEMGCYYYLYDKAEEQLDYGQAYEKFPGSGLYDVVPEAVYFINISIGAGGFCAYELALSLE